VKIEQYIREMTRPINGQYPRPWMTDSTMPERSEVFIVGRNQAKTYPVELLRDHDQHIDALFNRNGEGCRGLYDKLYPAPSPTRKNIARLSRLLKDRGIEDILETNVICYSTPMSSDLSQAEHRGGAARGTELFTGLLNFIRPRVVIAHGAGTVADLARVLKTEKFSVPDGPAKVCFHDVDKLRIYPIPSLAPPAWNSWSRWADEYLGRVSEHIRTFLQAHGERTHTSLPEC